MSECRTSQRMSHYPAVPPPVAVGLWESPEHDCAYLPGRQAKMRALMSRRLPAATYHTFMDANFRRSGKLIYQPSCAGCRACQSIRVITGAFRMSKSQRRVWRKNQDLLVTIGKPNPTEQKFQMYNRYLRQWHQREGSSFDEFVEFLYDSPVDSLECEYRDAAGALLAVGICDVSALSLSSVYFYFDPSECNRSLGTFGALWEIQWAAQQKIPHYYLGYFVRGCASMEYKASFRPCELLDSDGIWRPRDARET